MKGDITFSARIFEDQGVLVTEIDIRNLREIGIRRGPEQRLYQRQKVVAARTGSDIHEAIREARKTHGDKETAVIRVNDLAGIFTLQRSIPLN